MESDVQLIVRWFHIIAGIAWIGILYFFNFVNAPLQGVLDDAGKKAVNPQLMPRALWWFRWAAMITIIAGLALFVMIYMTSGGPLREGPGGPLSLRAKWIMFGMTFGTVMWFNVWFIIWPAQKKLLGGTAGDAAPALRKRAGLASKVNTYFSAPMLVGMIAGSHPPANSMTLLAMALVGVGIIWWCYRNSVSVGKSV